MELRYVFLADAAEGNPEGRFFVYAGGVEAIASSDLPSLVPLLSLVANIRLTPDECPRQHVVRVVGTTPEGEVFLPEIRQEFGPIPAPGGRRDFGSYTFVLSFRGLPISQFGTYRFTIFADDVALGHVELLSDRIPDPHGVEAPQEPRGG